MAFCASCGAAAASGATFCSNCGAPLAQPTPARKARTDTSTAEGLILAGAILGILMMALGGFVMLWAMVFLRGVAPFLDWDTWPFSVASAAFGFAGAIGVFLILLGVLWGAFALHARTLIRRGEVAQGGLLAIVAGGLFVLLTFASIFPAIAGGLVLAGGILARQAAVGRPSA